MIKNKLKWVLALAFTSAFQVNSFAGDNECVVSGTINGLQKDVKLTVKRRSGEYGNDMVKVSKTLENGAFSFTLPSTAFNEMLEMKFEGIQYAVTFFAEKGRLVINGEKAKLYAAELEGSPENERWNDYQQFVLGITKKRNALAMGGTAYSKEEKGKIFDALNAEQKHFEDSVVNNYPKSIVALYLAKVPLPMMKHYQIDSVLAHFKPYFAQHKYYLEMKKRADVLRKTAPGAMAPDFNVLQPDGKSKISLSSLRGKYVMLDFWASWCVPCRAENVHTKALYEKYHSKGLEIVSFSLDSDLQAWKKAVEKDGLVWNNASDLVGGKKSPVAQKYGIDGLPAVWIIDPKGRIVAEGVRGEQLEKLLESIFVH